MSQLARPSRVSRIPSRYRQTETEGDTPSRSQPTNNDAVVDASGEDSAAEVADADAREEVEVDVAAQPMEHLPNVQPSTEQITEQPSSDQTPPPHHIQAEQLVVQPIQVGSEAEESVRVTDDRLKWGQYHGAEAIRAKLEAAHAKITSWKSNFFQMPRNATGKEAIKEMTRLLHHFNNKTAWEPVAMHLLIVFITLMLQKPAKNSKNRQNTKYLKKRLDLWKEGNLSAIMSECEEVQRRMQSKSPNQKKESVMRGFSRLMMTGKVRQALKLVDADSEVTGVHAMNDEIREVLQRKHPDAEEVQQMAMNQSEVPVVENVIFEEINASTVIKSAE